METVSRDKTVVDRHPPLNTDENSIPPTLQVMPAKVYVFDFGTPRAQAGAITFEFLKFNFGETRAG
jgi:hypothetical protein